MEDPLPNWHALVYYDPKNPANLKDFQTRQLFLRVAAQTVPGFADAFFKVTGALINDWIKRNGSMPRYDSPLFVEFYNPFFDSIREWARSFNIESDWVINEAHNVAFLGPLYAQKGIDPVLAFGTWRRSLQTTPAIKLFHLPAWDPYAESPADYILRADLEWRRLRDEYIVATKAELARAGLKQLPTPRKRRVVMELRFAWAALTRCTGVSITDLADRYQEDTEVIRISVSRILKDLGFEPPT